MNDCDKHFNDHDKYFDMIKDKKDWRAPIVAKIKKSDFGKCNDACMFFTATELEIVSESDKDHYKVRAVGYRNGPAGP